MNKSGRQSSVVSTVVRPDGMRVHTLTDGRRFEEDGPCFSLEHGSPMGGSYKRKIAVFGVTPGEPHLFDAWCFVYNDLRSYAFSKVVQITNLETGETWDGPAMCAVMGGKMERGG